MNAFTDVNQQTSFLTKKRCTFGDHGISTTDRWGAVGHISATASQTRTIGLLPYLMSQPGTIQAFLSSNCDVCPSVFN